MLSAALKLFMPRRMRDHSTPSSSLSREHRESRWPCGLGLAMFPRFYPQRFTLRWSHFTLSILLPLLQVKDERLHILCPVRALKIYVDRSNIWRKSPQLLVCFGAGRRGLAHQSKEFLTGWEKLFRWLTLAFLHLSAFGRILLGAWPPLKLFSEGFPRGNLCSGRMVLSAHFLSGSTTWI